MPDHYFENPICPIPSLDGVGVESRGGADLTDGRRETDNSISHLPSQPTIIGVPGGPVAGSTHPPPDMTNWPNITTK